MRADTPREPPNSKCGFSTRVAVVSGCLEPLGRRFLRSGLLLSAWTGNEIEGEYLVPDFGDDILGRMALEFLAGKADAARNHLYAAPYRCGLRARRGVRGRLGEHGLRASFPYASTIRRL